MRLLITIMLLIPIVSLGQSATFRLIRMKTNLEGNIAYPLVQLKDKKIENRINDQIAYLVIGKKSSTETDLKENLKEMAEYTYALDHEVTYNKDHILSFSVFFEGCGAYCSSTSYYFNFDLKTGSSISVDDLAKPEKAAFFTSMLDSIVKASLIDYEQTELDSLAKTDSSTYSFVYSSFESCLSQININGFAIHPDRIVFYNECDYPHVIRAFTPNTEFIFTVDQLSAYLKPQYRFDLKKTAKTQKSVRKKKS